MTIETLHIFDILVKHPEGITREAVNWQLEDVGAKPLTRRQFAKAVELLRNTFHVSIESTRIGGLEFSYRLANADNPRQRTVSMLVDNLMENTFLEEFRSLGHRVQPVVIPRGHEFLRSIGRAMKKNLLLRCKYQKFTDEEPYDCILAPYVLKAYEGRWYLFAMKWGSMEEVAEHPMGTRGLGLQAFALDRMLLAKPTKETFKMYEGFSAAKYFKPFFGVFCSADQKPVMITVTASEDDAHYIRTLPLHHTQKEVSPGVFTLKMCVTKDFEIYMHRFENTTWRVES